MISRRHSIGTTISMIIFAIIIVSCSAIGIISYLQLGETVVDLLGMNALNVTKSVAGNIDSQKLISLIDNQSLDDSFYEDSHQWMLNINKEVKAEYLYILTEKNSRDFQYVIDGSREKNDPKFLSFGKVDSKDLLPEAATIAYETGESAVSEVWYGGEEYGNLISAFYPITDTRGDVIALVGCDLSANEAVAESKSHLPALVISVILVGLVFSAIMFWIFRKNISLPLKSVTEQAKLISTGDFKTRLDSLKPLLKKKNEFGELTMSFSDMQEKLNFYADISDKISKGDLDSEIIVETENDVLGLSLNKVIEELKELTAETDKLAEAAVQGDLQVRGDADRFEGGYRNIIVGINNTLNAISEPLQFGLAFINDLAAGVEPEAIANIEKYKGSYRDLIVNLSSVLASLKEMLGEIEKLSQASIRGNLKHRADISKLNGVYADIVSGINQTLDAIIEPVEEASSVLDEISKGVLDARVKGDYQGDHSKIKDALNITAETLQSYISEISGLLHNMANKDLTGMIEREYTGDFSQLRESLNYIIGEFNGIMQEIIASATEVESGATQVAHSSQILADGASEQASALEQISGNIAQITEQIKENSVNSSKAYEFAETENINATNGNEQMLKMLKAMDGIKESSNNISGVIKVINDIAFQTNILALNAAVEAARAGEHGKGFAVVAEEVRNLAARSALAVKETTELIDNSIVIVEEGYTLANSTAEMLNEISAGSARALTVTSEIAEASNQQSNAITEINRGAEEIASVTHNNTATAEESASASEEMASQAQLLRSMVQAFKLKGMPNVSVQPAKNTLPKAQELKTLDAIASFDEKNFGKY